MRNLLLVAVGAALLASTPLASSAQDRQDGPPGDRRPPMGQPGPGMSPGMNHGDMGPDHGGPGMDHGEYGRWDNGWGSRPPPPPRHYSRHGNWDQHVRSCQTRYRSYNPRTDMYVVRRGVMGRCRL